MYTTSTAVLIFSSDFFTLKLTPYLQVQDFYSPYFGNLMFTRRSLQSTHSTFYPSTLIQYTPTPTPTNVHWVTLFKRICYHTTSRGQPTLTNKTMCRIWSFSHARGRRHRCTPKYSIHRGFDCCASPRLPNYRVLLRDSSLRLFNGYYYRRRKLPAMWHNSSAVSDNDITAVSCTNGETVSSKDCWR